MSGTTNDDSTKSRAEIFDIDLPSDWTRRPDQSFNHPNSVWWRAKNDACHANGIPMTAPKVIEGFYELTLPPGWKREYTQWPPMPQAYWWQAKAPDNEEVHVGRWIVEKPYNGTSARNLRAILRAEPHAISGEELEQIEKIARGFPGSARSELLSAYTKKFGGEMCIMLERFWNAVDKRAVEVLVDHKQDGVFLNHFYFAAPPEDYGDFSLIALAAYESLRPETVDD